MDEQSQDEAKVQEIRKFSITLLSSLNYKAEKPQLLHL